MTQPKELKELIIEGIQDRKGHGITVVDFSRIDTAATGAFIIAEGNSTTHISAIAESVEEYVRKNGGIKTFGMDGEDGSGWIVLDYGNIWVHIFLPQTRRHYNLEELWSDAAISHIPDLD